MKILRQILIISAFASGGVLLSTLFNLPIPGNVMGMILLLGALITGAVKTEMIAEVTDFLLAHLAFFFLPPGVNLIRNLDLIKGNWLPILGVFFISTVLVMAVTGLTIQFLKKILSSKEV